MNDTVTGVPVPVKLHPAERRAVGAVALVLALRMFGLFVLLPVLALHASDLPGATPLLAGLAVGAFGIAQALLQIPAGILSDRIGRKSVIVLGLLIFVAGSVVAAGSDTIAGLLAGRVMQGAGAIAAAATALVADLTRDQVRTRAMAVVGIAIGMSFMAALALGPRLAGLLGVPGLFVLGAGLGLAAAAAVVAAPGGWSAPARQRRGSLREGLLNRRLWPLHLSVFGLHAMLTATFVAAPFLLRDRLEMATASHSGVYLAAMALSLAGTVPLILLAERARRPGWTFVTGVALLAAGQGLLALGNGVVDVVAALAVFFAGFNFLEARLPARVSSIAGEAVRGAALGAFATSQFLGAFCGGLVGGLLLGRSGPAGIAAVAALLAAGWTGIAVVATGLKRPGSA